MDADACNLGFEKGDTRVELVQRKAIQAFTGKKAGSAEVSFGRPQPRSRIIVHCGAASDSNRCLSMVRKVFAARTACARCYSMLVDTPATMTAIGFDSPGAADVLRPETIAVPSPGPGEVLIKVAFAGVNRPDVVQRQGKYPPPPGASPIPGLEISGTVVALGEGVTQIVPGARVCALVTGGGYAQYCLAKAAHCLPVPDGLPLDQAAALPETLFTVWHNVFERGYAREGETLLVHGGTSGIGTMATMLGRHFGLTVIVTCGSAQKCAAALKIGAHHAIDYKATDFVEEVNRLTDGRGVNLVLDMVAGSYVARNLKCLAPDGRHVTIAVQGGTQAEINMAVVMARRYTLTGSTMRARSDDFKALLAHEILECAWPLVENGALRPVMDACFPLDRAANAHARMEGGDHVGKIVLAV